MILATSVYGGAFIAWRRLRARLEHRQIWQRSARSVTVTHLGSNFRLKPCICLDVRCWKSDIGILGIRSRHSGTPLKSASRPAHGTPAAASASARPATRGASGPTTTSAARCCCAHATTSAVAESFTCAKQQTSDEMVVPSTHFEALCAAS